MRWRIACAALGVLAAWHPTAYAQDRLIDREPFDRIILDDANDNRELDVLPLDFPDRKLPERLPRSGRLRVRLVDHPLREFQVRWMNVAEIRLFEQLLLDEARQLADEGRFALANQYLAQLVREYPDLPNLAETVESVLEMEVARAYQQGDQERAWMVLTALFDRNPEHEGVGTAFRNVADRLLEARVGAGEFRQARHFLDLLRNRFGRVGGSVALRWSGKLQKAAEERAAKAGERLAAGHVDEARAMTEAALAIQPDLPDALVLMRRIADARPRLVVAVLAEAPTRLTRRLDDWPSRRVEPLIDPPLVELRGFGGDGGEYRSPYGELVHETDGMATSILLPPHSDDRGPTADALARRILSVVRSGSGGLRDGLAGHLAEIAIDGRQTLRLTWLHAHVRPEALLRIGVSDLVQLAAAVPAEGVGDPADAGPRAMSIHAGRYGPFQLKSRTSREVVFARADEADAPSRAVPLEIVERLFATDDDAIDALLRGEVDVVERLPATHVPRLAKHDGIIVGEYALPTVHVLAPSPNSRMMRLAELRRAIVYGLNRQALVQQLFIGDGPAQGASVISGPFAAGKSFTDPIGYAYNRTIEPRPFDPRLAATLTVVADRLRKDAGPAEEGGPEVGDLPELTLAHPSDASARAACQLMAEQLVAIGIPVQLKEYRPEELESGEVEFDLRYAELAMWEPVVDAPRLLGPRGELRECTARMGLALLQLERARTWQDVREALQDVHRVAHDQLDVIPLWQTTNYLAYRNTVGGIPSRPVTLYQNVDAWEVQRTREVAP